MRDFQVCFGACFFINCPISCCVCFRFQNHSRNCLRFAALLPIRTEPLTEPLPDDELGGLGRLCDLKLWFYTTLRDVPSNLEQRNHVGKIGERPWQILIRIVAVICVPNLKPTCDMKWLPNHHVARDSAFGGIWGGLKFTCNLSLFGKFTVTHFSHTKLEKDWMKFLSGKKLISTSKGVKFWAP